MTGALTLPDPPAPDALRSLGIQADDTCDRETRGVVASRQDHRSTCFGMERVRTYGPLLRFDPHALPVGEDPQQKGVWYAGQPQTLHWGSVPGQQDYRSRARQPVPDRALLHATPHRAGPRRRQRRRVGHAGGRNICDLDRGALGDRTLGAQYRRGLPASSGPRYNSRFAGGPCLALYLAALTAMPGRPKLSLPLNHPDLVTRIAGAARAVRVQRHLSPVHARQTATP